MRKSTVKRVLALLAIFMILFTNYGLPLYAIAAESQEIFETSIFKKSEISMKASFDDGTDETIKNVNDYATIHVELNPTVEGYLKQARLRLNLDDSDENNFKIASITQDVEDSDNSEYNSKATKSASDVVNSKNDFTVTSGNVEEIPLVSSNKRAVISEDLQEESVDANVEDLNTTDNVVTTNANTEDETLVSDSSDTTNAAEELSGTTEDYSIVQEQKENVVDNTASNSVEDTDTNTITTGTNTTTETVTTQEEQASVADSTFDDIQVITNLDVDTEEFDIASEDVDPDKMIDEEEYIDQAMQEVSHEQNNNRIFIEASSIKLTADNEILLENISSKTKLNINIVYIQKDEVNVNDLYKDLNVTLEGTFVNDDLEEKNIAKKAVLNLGWKYTKDIELTSEYTKVSPFSVGENNGTIVENEIVVKRDIKDSKYLPVKSTELSIQVPELNNKYPTMVDVGAKKLMLTLGQEVGNTTFTTDNWKYDEKNHTITIKVNNIDNGLAVNSKGEDVYVVTYRYEDYFGKDNIDLAKNVEAKVEEYSAKNGNVIRKSIKTEQNKDINVGELITYAMGANEDKISKGTINASYIADEPIDTVFSSVVSINILTSDMLDTITLDNFSENYFDKSNNTYKADDDVYYKGINFKYAEIQDLLNNGSTIDILDTNGNVIYTMTKDNTTNDENSKIEFSELPKNIVVKVNNVSNNGTINVEFVKVIKKSNYPQRQFTTFTKIESSVRASIKYVGREEEFNLNAIYATKDFKESYTKANIYMNQNYLNTTSTNENVEIKVVLNNDNKSSDLYKNPGFEIVFPKYVKNVEIVNMNLANNEGLKVADFRTMTVNENVVVKIDLEGVQQNFATADLTNGTNILLNCNIELSEFTPKKEDQIKLYYYNEAVTNYESQTRWSLTSGAPSGMIRATNGFDVAVFEYQAPSGLITATAIRNYDGDLGVVSSVRQGEVTATLKRDSASRIATMELTTLNNTGNKCSDLSLIGRFPFKGNKDIITGDDLGTNTDVVIKDLIKEDNANPVGAKIYYSAKEDATKNLNLSSNEWVEAERVNSLADVKSFLIVVDGSISAGDTFKFTYDFEIPENLPYEVAIFGTYAAYYNNIGDNATIYESADSDKVGLTTGTGPKLDINISLDNDNGKTVQGKSRVKVNVDVKNVGGEDLDNVSVKVPIPIGAKYMQYGIEGTEPFSGDYYYKTDSNITEYNGRIDKLSAGDTQHFEFYILTPDSNHWYNSISGKDKDGYFVLKQVVEEYHKEEDHDEEEHEEEYYEEDHDEEDHKGRGELIKNSDGTYSYENSEIKYTKEYVTETPAKEMKLEATATTPKIAEETKSGEFVRTIKETTFYIESSVNANKDVYKTAEIGYQANLKNISGESIKNAVLTFNTGEILEFTKAYVMNGKIENGTYEEDKSKEQIDESKKSSITSDEKQRIKDEIISVSNDQVRINIGDFNKDEIKTIRLYFKAKKIEESSILANCYFEIKADGKETEYGTRRNQKIVRPILKAEDVFDSSPIYVKEDESFAIQTKITNVGEYTSTSATLDENYTENIVLNGNDGAQYDTVKEENGSTTSKYHLPLIEPGESIIVESRYKAKNLDGEKDFSAQINRVLKAEDQSNIRLDEYIINVGNSNLTEEEAENARINELNKQHEEERALKQAQEEENVKQQLAKQAAERTHLINNPTTSNNSKTNTNSQSENRNVQIPSNTENDVVKPSQEVNTQPKVEKYAITGTAWEDTNKDGSMDEDENRLKDILVSLVNSESKVIVATTKTTQNGKYDFNNIEKGKYYITFSYDNTVYTTTAYRKNGVDDTRSSKVLSSESNKTTVTTEVFTLNDNVRNMNVGFIKVNVFDFEVSKTLTHAKVTLANGKYTDYDAKKADVYKIEIKSRNLKDAVVELEYTISLKNIGQADGYAEQLIDVVPEGMELSNASAELWSIGKDGRLYSQNLSNSIIAAGETRELKLVLTKKMTNENTGLVSNRAELVSGYGIDQSKVENTDNNSSVQNTFIMPSTGDTFRNISISAFIVFIAFIGYMFYTKKFELPKFGTKKIYK